MNFSIDPDGWYWAPNNELRQCVVTTLDGIVTVLDYETMLEAPVLPEDVMVEKPE